MSYSNLMQSDKLLFTSSSEIRTNKLVGERLESQDGLRSIDLTEGTPTGTLEITNYHSPTNSNFIRMFPNFTEMGQGLALLTFSPNDGETNIKRNQAGTPGAEGLTLSNSTQQHTAFYTDGSAENLTGNWGTISDRRLKTNVKKASSQWEDIKKLNIVNYSLKSDLNSVLLGVIAQEVEEICPSLVVKHKNKLGVKQSVIYMKSVKALQEAQKRIEKLEEVIKSLHPEIDLSVVEEEYEDKYKDLENEKIKEEKEINKNEVEEYLKNGWTVKE